MFTVAIGGSPWLDLRWETKIATMVRDAKRNPTLQLATVLLRRQER